MGRHVLPEARNPRVCDCGDHGFAPLTKGAVAFFSPHRLADVEGARWNVLSSGSMRHRRYARTTLPGRKYTLMHCLFAGSSPGEVVDHIDGDGLNNRDENLRVCVHAENVRNVRRVMGSVPFKGVRRQRNGRFYSSIAVDGRRVSLGGFTSPEAAARAYDRAAVALHGQFACTNVDLGLLPPEAASQ